MPKTQGERPESDDRPAWRRAAPPAPERPSAPRRKRQKLSAEDERRRIDQEAVDLIREVREEEEE